MENRTSYDIICSYMPMRLREIMIKVSPHQLSETTEIRLRINRPISYISATKYGYLNQNSEIVPSYFKELITIEKNEIEQILQSLCKYSVHSCSRELSQGFFTIENGIRVGVSGSFASIDTPVLKYVSGLNFRISREITGCAEELFNKVYSQNSYSVLICGSVNSGKTTILRDLCRLCGNSYKVTLIDERSEIASAIDGVAQHDIGIQTDLLEGCSRANGIISAIRTLSPQLIVCDEISTFEDCEAILRGQGCGVKFIATAHAESFEDLKSRTLLEPLFKMKVFDYVIFLEGESKPGKVSEVRRLYDDI